MTYEELLKKTAQRKQKAVRELNQALRGNTGWLVEAEIKRNPGSVAWLWLAKDFCEELAEHVEEFIGEFGIDTTDAREVGDIYMAYEDGSSDLYDLLPTEARLFDR